ncbi:MAG TPA: hypothetical protein VMZ71_07175, partial [Gemmataceae bacterium]|nr:hypothetical protein [Gemmataceae bacterium]
MQVFQFQHAEGHPPRFLRFDPTGRLLAAGWRPVVLFDTHRGSQIPTPGLELAGAGLAFAGASLVFTVPQAGTVARYDLATGETFRRRYEHVWYSGLAAAPDGEAVLVSVGGYGLRNESEIRVLRVADFEVRASIPNDAGAFVGIELSADGNWLVGDTGVHLRVWSVGVGRFSTRARRKIETDGYTYGFGLTHDGAVVAVATSRGVAAWDVASGEQLFKSGKHRRAVTALACAPDRPLIATGDREGQVFL